MRDSFSKAFNFSKIRWRSNTRFWFQAELEVPTRSTPVELKADRPGQPLLAPPPQPSVEVPIEAAGAPWAGTVFPGYLGHDEWI